jgi:CRISPR-associated protein Cmr1
LREQTADKIREMLVVEQREPDMKKLEYQVSFTTPAFLGNAEQAGQWRTPPFKALLRQWWRVTYSAQRDFRVDVAAMRREEGRLFGHAWLEDDRDKEGNKVTARKSLVRIRLEMPDGDAVRAWSLGTQQGVAPLGTGLDTSYAWFGLIKRGGGLPDRTAIKAGDKECVRTLHLAYPDVFDQRMQEVIRLIDAFGLLGSRSRGGWGALHVHEITPLSGQEMARYAQPLPQCLQRDWATSLALDSRGLCVWQGRSNYPTWDKAMRAVASLRKEVRGSLKGVQGRDLRQALGFAGNGRMPSPLRWKLLPAGNGQLTLRVYAMPHDLPADSGAAMNRQQLQQAWATACGVLDQSDVLQRVR